MQREFYTVLHQLSLDEHWPLTSKLVKCYISLEADTIDLVEMYFRCNYKIDQLLTFIDWGIAPIYKCDTDRLQKLIAPYI